MVVKDGAFYYPSEAYPKLHPAVYRGAEGDGAGAGDAKVTE